MASAQQDARGSSRFRRFLRQSVVVLVVGLTSFWLFGDTFARYVDRPHDSRTIRFAHFGSWQDHQLWREVIADFENEHPGARVVQEYAPGFSFQLEVKLRQQAASGDLPEVMLLQLTSFDDHVWHLADVTDVLTAGEGFEIALQPTARAAFERGGAVHAVPVSGGPLVIYLNLRCLERARVAGRDIDLPVIEDWTVSRMREVARDLTVDFDGDGAVDQFGFWLPRWVYYQPFVWSFGGEVLDLPSGEWRFYGDEAERALQFYLDVALVDRSIPRDQDVPQLYQDTALITGRVAMAVNGPWFLATLA